MSVKLFSILSIVCLLSSCVSKQKIVYSYELTINKALEKGKSEMISKFGITDDDTFFIIMFGYMEKHIVLSTTQNLTPSLKEIIQNSNRYFVLNSRYVPVIFMSDLNTMNISERAKHYRPNGFFITLDFHDKIIDTGYLF